MDDRMGDERGWQAIRLLNRRKELMRKFGDIDGCWYTRLGITGGDEISDHDVNSFL